MATDPENSDRWNRVEELFHAALEQPVEGRGGFLDRACSSDTDVRREVESLLRASASGDALLERPAIAQMGLAASPAPAQRSAWSPGMTIGHYRIVEPLGAGGMGEVFRARDTRLDRDVALKTLPPDLSLDRSYLERLRREARSLASVNHPNVATLYEIEDADGHVALVMELVEGETLAKRLSRSRLRIGETLAIATQIAEALEAAHRKGIVHRDLKPGNVMIARGGLVKVLDFGLAKRGQGSDGTDAVLTAAPTSGGTVLGTAGYMSPEQAEGEEVDHRSDIFSFGAILYEMVAGHPAFGGDTAARKLASVLRDEPPPLENQALDAPQWLLRVIRLCLRKIPDERYQNITDVKFALVELKEDLEPGEAPTASSPVSRRRVVFGAARAAGGAAAARRPWGWITASVLAVALTLVLYFRPADEVRVFRLSVVPPKDGSFNVFTSVPLISPNGRQVAIVATTGGKDAIWLRGLDSLTGRWLAGTDGASYPFWSPDSRALGFFSGGKLKKVELAGDLAVTLCDAPGTAGGSWSQAGVIIFARRYLAPIMRIPEGGGTPQPVTRQNEGGLSGQRFPWFLPDGRHFLYLNLDTEPEKSGIYVAALDSNESRRLLPDVANAVYAQPGYLLYLRGSTLMAQPFDVDQTRISGQAVAIAEKIDRQTDTLHGAFSTSVNGVLLYSEGSGTGSTQLTWFDSSGRPNGTAGPPASVQWPAISPDGKAVVVDQQDPGTGSQELWLHDLARAVPSRFTFNSMLSRYAVWSPDGSHIAFVSNRDGFFKIYQKAVSGSSPEELLHTTPPAWPDDWSHDGRYLILEVPAGPINGSRDLWVLPLGGDRKAFPYLQTKANERWGRLSPDGRWLAYSSDESSRVEVYVTTFPNPGGKWQVSTAGGDVPAWGRDGKSLFFLGPDRKMMAAEVKEGERFEASAPKPLFDTHIAPGPQVRFDVGPDGRFLIPVQHEPIAAAPLTVVVNWAAGLKK
jgi:eukaryotic-like serine/threonine-protein kinase